MFAESDSLSSWKEGTAKAGVRRFVVTVTDADGNYVTYTPEGNPPPTQTPRPQVQHYYDGANNVSCYYVVAPSGVAISCVEN